MYGCVTTNGGLTGMGYNGLGATCPASVASPYIQHCGAPNSDPSYVNCMATNIAETQNWMNLASAAGCLPTAPAGSPAATLDAIAAVITALGTVDFPTIWDAIPEATPAQILTVLSGYTFTQGYNPGSGVPITQIQAAFAMDFPTATAAQLAAFGNPTSGPQPAIDMPTPGPTSVEGTPVVISTAGTVLPAGSNPNVGAPSISTLTPSSIGTAAGAAATSPGQLVPANVAAAAGLPGSSPLAAASLLPAVSNPAGTALISSSFFTDSSIIGGVPNWAVIGGGFLGFMLLMKAL